ncbi:MAG: D-alanine--D-alanine ligase family protein [Anaerolineales bacterium]|jgi:D-alanine-D-alanine ligase
MMMKSRVRVGVMFGGRSGEHEVSLMSARSILDALDPEKYEVTQIGIKHSGTWLVGDTVLDALDSEDEKRIAQAVLLPDPNRPELYRLRMISEAEEVLEKIAALDVIFSVLHGTFGEDGAMQGLFEANGVAYVGSGIVGSAVGMDKGIFKDVMTANNIPVVESMLILRSELEANMEAVLDRIEALVPSKPYPLFVKPANLGSSVGISKCHSRADLIEGLMDAARYDRRVVIERGVNAREIEVSVLGNDDPQASVAGEVIPSREFYSYEAKYIDGSSDLLIPAPIPDDVADQVRKIAVQAYQAIDCAGMARVDFLLDIDSGEVFLSEVNTLPGFTKFSMYPKLWAASGLPYSKLVDRLIELAMERKADRDRIERKFRKE